MKKILLITLFFILTLSAQEKTDKVISKLKSDISVRDSLMTVRLNELINKDDMYKELYFRNQEAKNILKMLTDSTKAK